jgi:ketosteroid isomerase-like protein
MSEENVEVVRRMYEAFHGGDGEGALAFFDQDVVVEPHGRVDAGIGRGQEALNRIITTWVGTFDEWREEIDDVRDLGDQVFVAATQRGRGKGSGVEIETHYASSMRYRATRSPVWTCIWTRRRPSKPPGCRRTRLETVPRHLWPCARSRLPPLL